MGDFIRRDILRLEVATIDTPGPYQCCVFNAMG